MARRRTDTSRRGFASEFSAYVRKQVRTSEKKRTKGRYGFPAFRCLDVSYLEGIAKGGLPT